MDAALPKLPPRRADGHKGTFGTVGVLGGQAAPPRMMLGGPAFTALAALRSGAGLAVLAVPAPVLAEALVVAPSATGLALPVDDRGRLKPSSVASLLDQHLLTLACLAIGPGLGADEPQQQIVVRLVAQEDVPIVLDADGLNALAALPDFKGDFRARAILTPHVGEFRRLAAALGIRHDAGEADQREAVAGELAQRLGCVVVLKGAGTIVTDGMQSWTNTTGNAALATAGTGDVLTGVIASFVAQFHRPHLGIGSRQVTPEQQGGLGLFDCARLAVHVHGLAADRWASRHGNAGLLATDLIDALPDVIRDARA